MKIGTKTALVALAAVLAGSPPAHALVSCGAVITTNEVMTGNLFCIFNDPVLTIDGGSLDMNGHQIGCLSGQDGVTFINSGGSLRNGSIEGCDRGAVLAGLGKHSVTNVLAKGGNDTGFLILGSGNKLVKNVASGFTNDGFRAATALPPLSDIFVDNVSANNGGNGFLVTGDSSKMAGNLAVGNGEHGIYLIGDGNKLSRNISYNNGFLGLRIDGHENGVAENTTIANSGPGIGVFGSQTKVKANHAIDNGAEGYATLGNANAFSSNTSVLNAGKGFVLFGDDLKLSKSSAILNDESGMWTDGGNSGLQFKGNRLLSNGDIGLVVESTATLIKGNLGYGNANADADDINPMCAGNTWKGNVFGDKADACID